MTRRDFKIERKINLGRDASDGGGMSLAVAFGGAVIALFALIAAIVAANS